MNMQTFQEVFSRMMSDRIDCCALMLAMNNPKRQELSEKCSELMQKIFDILGEEHSHLLFTLEETINLESIISLEYAYKQGFRDGIVLNRELDRIASEGVANDRSFTC